MFPRNNTSGTRGVSYDSKRNMWWAQIKRDGVRTYLGHFADKESGVKARLSAEKSCKEQSVFGRH